jgi:hypothetical protein
MYYIVYLTRNIINQKIYVGVHSTYNLKDSYLGSGNALKSAFKKHGRRNFERTVLHYCLTEENMYDWEASIVTQDFLDRPDHI